MNTSTIKLDSQNESPSRSWISRKTFISLIAVAALLIFTFFFDNALLRRGVGLRFSWLDGLMLYLTDFGMLFFAVVLVFSLIYQRQFRWLTMLALSLSLSFEVSYLLKLIFQVPRPYFNLELATIPLTQASGYSFPSLHSAFCLGILPFLDKIYPERWKRILATIIALAIAYSRAYLGVHYFSDILAGGLIGYLFSKIAIVAEQKFHFIDWFLGHVKSKLELRRQIAHLIIGVLVVFLIELKLLTPNLLLLTLILGLALSLTYKKYPIPIIHEILQLFERPKDLATFPGRGFIFLLLGSYLSLMFFPLSIAKAAIIILAIGDSISHIVGRYFGRTKVPFSAHKMLEGTIVAIIFSTLGALLFVDFHMAFLASLLTITFESIYPEKLASYLDDNIAMPLLAGAIMMVMS